LSAPAPEESEHVPAKIQHPATYYDPTVIEVKEVDPLTQALLDDAARRAEPAAKLLDHHLKEQARAAADVQEKLHNKPPVYIPGLPDKKIAKRVKLSQ